MALAIPPHISKVAAEREGPAGGIRPGRAECGRKCGVKPFLGPPRRTETTAEGATAMAWQTLETAPRDRLIRLARDNGCAWEFWVAIWSLHYDEYPWLVIDQTGVNYLPEDRPDYWHELEDIAPPHAIEF